MRAADLMQFSSEVSLGDGRTITATIWIPHDDAPRFDFGDYQEYVQIAVSGMHRNVQASDEQRKIFDNQQAAERMAEINRQVAP